MIATDTAHGDDSAVADDLLHPSPPIGGRRGDGVADSERGEFRHAGVAALVETLRSNAYRRDLEAFGPYDTQRTGEEIR